MKQNADSQSGHKLPFLKKKKQKKPLQKNPTTQLFGFPATIYSKFTKAPKINLTPHFCSGNLSTKAT